MEICGEQDSVSPQHRDLNQASPLLGYAEIRSINDVRRGAVAQATEVGGQFVIAAVRGQAGHVFDQHDAWPELLGEPADLVDQVVSRVRSVAQPKSGEPLARRARRDQEQVPAQKSQATPQSARVHLLDVFLLQPDRRMVRRVGGRRILVVFDGRNDPEASVRQPFRCATCSGEEVDCRHRCHGLILRQDGPTAERHGRCGYDAGAGLGMRPSPCCAAWHAGVGG